MSKNGNHNAAGDGKTRRRRFTKQFKEEAVQMLLEGPTAGSVAERLGLSVPSLLYAWKRQLIGQAGKSAATLESRVRELEKELQRVEWERDVLKKRCAFSAATGERLVRSHRSTGHDGGVFGDIGLSDFRSEPVGFFTLGDHSRSHNVTCEIGN